MRRFAILNRSAAALSAAALSTAMLTVIVAFAFPAEELSKVITQSHIVHIRNLEFSPRALDVEPGDTVTWINEDLVPHTVTADDESWNSELIEANGQWQTVVKEGLRDTYFCRFHPSMKGRLNIAVAQIHLERSDFPNAKGE